MREQQSGQREGGRPEPSGRGRRWPVEGWGLRIGSCLGMPPMPLCLILMAEPTATSTRVAHILLSIIAFLPSKQQPLITAIPNT